jgi:hypothetical protein
VGPTVARGFKPENVKDVRLGMTEAELTSLLGSPLNSWSEFPSHKGAYHYINYAEPGVSILTHIRWGWEVGASIEHDRVVAFDMTDHGTMTCGCNFPPCRADWFEPCASRLSAEHPAPKSD